MVFRLLRRTTKGALPLWNSYDFLRKNRVKLLRRGIKTKNFILFPRELIFYRCYYKYRVFTWRGTYEAKLSKGAGAGAGPFRRKNAPAAAP